MFEKIELGIESSVRDTAGSDFNSLDAYVEVVAAVEASARNTAQLDMLKMTAANIERGNTLAMAVADATGDQSVGVTVGAESFSMAMGLIGYGEAGQVAVGAESVTAGVESISDMAKKVMEAVKKYSLKALELAHEILIKVMNFIKGLFGKKEATSDDIDKLVEKAKKDGRTALGETDFDDSTKERLLKELPMLIVENQNKELTGKVYEEYIDSMNVDSTLADSLGTKVVGNAIVMTGFDKDGKIDSAKTGAESNKTLGKKLAGKLEDMIGGGKALLSDNTTRYNEGTEVINTTFKSAALLGLIEDNFSVGVLELAKTPSKLAWTAMVVSKEANELFTLLNSDDPKNVKGDEIKTSEEYLKMVEKILAGISIKNGTEKISDFTAIEAQSANIKPLEVAECAGISKKLVEKSKNINASLKTILKGVDSVKKATDGLSKIYSENNIENESDVSVKHGAAVRLKIYNKGLEPYFIRTWSF